MLDFIKNNYKKTTDSVFLINAESPNFTIDEMNYLLLIENPIDISIFVKEADKDWYANLNKYFLYWQILNNPNKTILYLTDYHYYCNEFADLWQNLSKFKVKRIMGDLNSYKFNNGCMLYTTTSNFVEKYDLFISDKITLDVDLSILSEHRIILSNDVENSLDIFSKS